MELLPLHQMIANPGEISGWSLLTRMLLFYVVALILFVIGLVQHAQRNRRKAKNIIVYFVAPIPMIMAIFYSLPYFQYANDSFVQAGAMVGGGSELIYKAAVVVSVVLLALMFVIAKVADARVEAQKERV
jgi:uncharacterized membrane protein